MQITKLKSPEALAALALLVGAGVWGWRHYGPKTGASVVYQGQARRPAPEFRLQDSSETERTLSSFRGRPVILHFWATWCQPCLSEIPDLIEAGRGWPDISVVTVSLDDTWGAVEKLMPHAELPANFTSLIDFSKKVPEDFGTYQYPESYLIDRDGAIIMKWVGAQDWKSEKTKAFLDRILSETPEQQPQQDQQPAG